MFDYTFVTIEVFSIIGKPKHDYKDIIHEYANKGWRLHQVISPPCGSGGQAAYIELIFEKPKDPVKTSAVYGVPRSVPN